MSEQDEQQQNPEKTDQVRPKKLANVVKVLVWANVLVFAAQYFFLAFMGIDLMQYFALFNFRSEHFTPYQFITHMFLHGGAFHIFLNMFILWMFGSSLEYVWKAKRFFIYYFITGIGAGFLHLAVSTFTISQLEESVENYKANPGYENFETFVEEEVGAIPEHVPPQAEVLQNIRDLREQWAEEPQNPQHEQASKELAKSYLDFYIDRPSVGASGAVFGILLAFGLLFPNVLIYLWFLFPIKAKYFVIFLGALELYLGVFAENNIANFAHLGGMLFGFILLKIWGEKPRKIKQA
jgi:membrane associated rhomboid family serine protease